MTLQQLRYVIQAADSHSMNEAARELFISQPTLSGLLDEATAEAIASFQVLSGLPMTGQLDKHTWKHLVLQYPLAAGLQSAPD